MFHNFKSKFEYVADTFLNVLFKTHIFNFRVILEPFIAIWGLFFLNAYININPDTIKNQDDVPFYYLIAMFEL